eukprot:TRINITY_DN8672_c0_g1_i1.p1 TRINITY_DN8672_c0_g1~~TRINITY_DN8672_c0_g1_i1.p1  ORF type:complete len:484 (+),score=102.32 TRINITY_DN8672_c0_g1_i1:290-1741(+)
MTTHMQIKDLDRFEGLQKQQVPLLGEDQVNTISSSESQRQLQPDINQGIIGHVAHGKSSLARAISGTTTIRTSEEKIRNITIRLGYANFKVFKCNNLLCPPPVCYQSFSSKEFKPLCSICNSDMTLVRHMSFVDCPGHEMLMRTMLNGAAVMDGGILVVAANEGPQPQTAEHLVAAEIMGLSGLITVQNKCDLVTQDKAFASMHQIREFLNGSAAEDAKIIPMSCAPNFICNVDVLLQYLVERVPVPVRNLTAPAHMKIIRSFDINKPGTPIKSIKGGVCGGSIVAGVLQIGEIVEIRPGIVRTFDDGRVVSTPIISKVVSLFSENNPLKVALPGGLIAVGLTLDPILSRADRLVGQVLGRWGTLPPVFSGLQIEGRLLRRLVGLAASNPESNKVTKLKKDEQLLLTVGSLSVAAQVASVSTLDPSLEKKHFFKVRVTLASPACAEIGDKVSISRSVSSPKRWRLIGWGTISAGKLGDMESMI